ncbi:hypothetical protein [Methanobrevibacter sp.]
MRFSHSSPGMFKRNRQNQLTPEDDGGKMPESAIMVTVNLSIWPDMQQEIQHLLCLQPCGHNVSRGFGGLDDNFPILN